eukprot:6331600-Amphidinium_carterae.2
MQKPAAIHNQTHLPHAPRYEVCRAARAKEAPHYRIQRQALSEGSLRKVQSKFKWTTCSRLRAHLAPCSLCDGRWQDDSKPSIESSAQTSTFRLDNGSTCRSVPRLALDQEVHMQASGGPGPGSNQLAISSWTYLPGKASLKEQPGDRPRLKAVKKARQEEAEIAIGANTLNATGDLSNSHVDHTQENFNADDRASIPRHVHTDSEVATCIGRREQESSSWDTCVALSTGVRRSMITLTQGCWLECVGPGETLGESESKHGPKA